MSVARATLLLIAAAACVAPASATAPAVAALGWLTGCWQRNDAEPGSGEQWTEVAGGTLLGVSRTIRGGRTIEYEFVLIREGSDGRLVYVAHPSGQAAAEFTSTRVARDEVVFANPDHDFPQRIGYRRTGRDLLAWIEGPADEGTRRIEFPMRRRACDSEPGLDAYRSNPT